MTSPHMSFLDHSITWAKGEAFEMSVLAIAGTLLLLGAGLLWKFASTPVGQALPIPLTVVALIFLGAGINGYLGTPAKLAEYQSAFEQSPSGFVEVEKTRVDGFAAIYTYTIIGAALAFAAAIFIFAVSDNATWRAVAVALMLIGFAGLVIDMFSQERAADYQQAIDAEIRRLNATVN